MIGDPLFTVPLNTPSMTSAASSLSHANQTLLCFEVHGARDAIFNLISDRCTTVNALYSAMVPPASGNIVSEVGIKAVDSRGDCLNIGVSLRTQCMPVITGSGTTTVLSRYNAHGVSVRRHRKGVRVAVPNCENTRLVMWVLCDEVRGQRMVKFVVARGVNLRPTAHGILGTLCCIPSCCIYTLSMVHVYTFQCFNCNNKYFSNTIIIMQDNSGTFPLQFLHCLIHPWS